MHKSCCPYRVTARQYQVCAASLINRRIRTRARSDSQRVNFVSASCNYLISGMRWRSVKVNLCVLAATRYFSNYVVKLLYNITVRAKRLSGCDFVCDDREASFVLNYNLISDCYPSEMDHLCAFFQDWIQNIYILLIWPKSFYHFRKF